MSSISNSAPPSISRYAAAASLALITLFSGVAFTVQAPKTGVAPAGAHVYEVKSGSGDLKGYWDDIGNLNTSGGLIVDGVAISTGSLIAGQGLTKSGDAIFMNASITGASLEILGTASGRTIHAQDNLTSSGSLQVDGNAEFKSTATIAGDLSLSSTITIGGVTYTFPVGDGSATGKVLATDGAGQLSWTDGGSASPWTDLGGSVIEYNGTASGITLETFDLRLKDSVIVEDFRTPTVSSGCGGTSNTITGNNFAGTIVTSGGANTTCGIAFSGGGFPTGSSCIVIDSNTAHTLAVTYTGGTSFTITTGAGNFGNATISYHCVGF